MIDRVTKADLLSLETAVFRAAPKDFVVARDALAAAQKAAGDAAAAKATKAWRRPAVPVWVWNRAILDEKGEDGGAADAIAIATRVAHAIAKSNPAKAELETNIAELRSRAAAFVGHARQLAAAHDVGLSLAQERELQGMILALPFRKDARELAARGRLLELPEAIDPLEAMAVLAMGTPVRATPNATKGRSLPDAANDDGRAASAAERERLAAAADRAKRDLTEAENALRDARAETKQAEEAMLRAQAIELGHQRAVDAAKEQLEQARAALAALRGR